MIETRGVATVVIGLVRPHLETTRPPRALFVPFELGRPLGEPEDAAFQGRVLTAALSLLERDDGAVGLEDFAEDAPGAADNPAWRPPFVANGAGFAAELAETLPRWRDAVARRGRTTVGASRLPPEAWPDLVAVMLADEPPGPDSSLSLRYLADDLKALYGEVAQPRGAPAPSSRQLNRWLFRETEAGRTLVALREAGTEGGNEALRTVARFMVPVPYLPAS
jgi:hypothetical protein